MQALHGGPRERESLARSEESGCGAVFLAAPYPRHDPGAGEWLFQTPRGRLKRREMSDGMEGCHDIYMYPPLLNRPVHCFSSSRCSRLWIQVAHA